MHISRMDHVVSDSIGGGGGGYPQKTFCKVIEDSLLVNNLSFWMNLADKLPNE